MGQSNPSGRENLRPNGAARLFRLTAFLTLLLMTALSVQTTAAAGDPPDLVLSLTGRVVNDQGAAVDHADVQVLVDERPVVLTVDGELTDSATTDHAGYFVIDIPLPDGAGEGGAMLVEIGKPSYRSTRQEFQVGDCAFEGAGYHARLHEVVLVRSFNAAFFIAAAVFAVVLASSR